MSMLIFKYLESQIASMLTREAPPTEPSENLETVDEEWMEEDEDEHLDPEECNDDENEFLPDSVEYILPEKDFGNTANVDTLEEIENICKNKDESEIGSDNEEKITIDESEEKTVIEENILNLLNGVEKREIIIENGGSAFNKIDENEIYEGKAEKNIQKSNNNIENIEKSNETITKESIEQANEMIEDLSYGTKTKNNLEDLDQSLTIDELDVNKTDSLTAGQLQQDDTVLVNGSCEEDTKVTNSSIHIEISTNQCMDESSGLKGQVKEDCVFNPEKTDCNIVSDIQENHKDGGDCEKELCGRDNAKNQINNDKSNKEVSNIEDENKDNCISIPEQSNCDRMAHDGNKDTMEVSDGRVNFESEDEKNREVYNTGSFKEFNLQDNNKKVNTEEDISIIQEQTQCVIETNHKKHDEEEMNAEKQIDCNEEAYTGGNFSKEISVGESECQSTKTIDVSKQPEDDKNLELEKIDTSGEFFNTDINMKDKESITIPEKIKQIYDGSNDAGEAEYNGTGSNNVSKQPDEDEKSGDAECDSSKSIDVCKLTVDEQNIKLENINNSEDICKEEVIIKYEYEENGIVITDQTHRSIEDIGVDKDAGEAESKNPQSINVSKEFEEKEAQNTDISVAEERNVKEVYTKVCVTVTEHTECDMDANEAIKESKVIVAEEVDFSKQHEDESNEGVQITDISNESIINIKNELDNDKIIIPEEIQCDVEVRSGQKVAIISCPGEDNDKKDSDIMQEQNNFVIEVHDGNKDAKEIIDEEFECKSQKNFPAVEKLDEIKTNISDELQKGDSVDSINIQDQKHFEAEGNNDVNEIYPAADKDTMGTISHEQNHPVTEVYCEPNKNTNESNSGEDKSMVPENTQQLGETQYDMEVVDAIDTAEMQPEDLKLNGITKMKNSEELINEEKNIRIASDEDAEDALPVPVIIESNDVMSCLEDPVTKIIESHEGLFAVETRASEAVIVAPVISILQVEAGEKSKGLQTAGPSNNSIAVVTNQEQKVSKKETKSDKNLIEVEDDMKKRSRGLVARRRAMFEMNN